MSRWADLLKSKAAEALAAQVQPQLAEPASASSEPLAEEDLLLADAEPEPGRRPCSRWWKCVRLEAFGRKRFMSKWKYDLLVQWNRQVEENWRKKPSCGPGSTSAPVAAVGRQRLAQARDRTGPRWRVARGVAASCTG